MPRKKTMEEYVKECKEKGYDLPIEDYKGTHIKIKYKCSKGHIYLQTPAAHLRGQGCPTCGQVVSNTKRRKSSEEYYQECKEKGLDLPIEDYVNATTKIKHKCINGHIYKQSPPSHLSGHGCPICKGIIKKYNKLYFIQECKEKGLDLPIEDYVNARTKINFKCKQGHIYKQSPNHHLRDNGCPVCANIKNSNALLKTPKEYYQECKEKGLDLPIENYINNYTKIKHKCNNCGNIYKQTPSNHLRGQGCPVCNESKGEKFIRNYLDKHCIKYIFQKTFKGLKDKQSLSYDFYLSDSNILIEYQGIQHFERVSFNGKGYTDLDKQKHHDRLKQRFAKENGYKLLRPTYKTNTQEKINKYLDRYLLKYLTNN